MLLIVYYLVFYGCGGLRRVFSGRFVEYDGVRT